MVSQETTIERLSGMVVYRELDLRNFKKQERERVKDLLFSLHTFNKLDDRMVRIISESLEIDAKEVCSKEGITYNI